MSELLVYTIVITIVDVTYPELPLILPSQLLLLVLILQHVCITSVFFIDGYVYDYDDLQPVKQHFTTSYNNGNMTFVLKNEYCFHINITRPLSRYHRESWFHNGTMLQLNTNVMKYNSSFHAKQNGEVMFMLKVFNLSAVDLGEYMGVIRASFYDVLSSCYDYSNLFPFHWWLLDFTLPIATYYYSVNIYIKFLLKNLL